MKTKKEKVFTRKLAKKMTGETITIPDGYTSIGAWAFFGNNTVRSITIPLGVTSIAHNAFYKCSNLTEVKIPAGVTSIGEHAFRECLHLKKLRLPKSLMHIGKYAFSECVRLKSVRIPDNMIQIEERVFASCYSLTSIFIPNSIQSIGESAFGNCASLKEIKIPDSVTIIERGLFRECRSLSDVLIPNSVQRIGDLAFCNCASLKAIEIPNSVTSIGWAAFCGECTLESVFIPASVVSIGKGAFSGAEFYMGLGGMKAIYVDDYNPSYSSIDGVLFNKEKTALLQYPKHIGKRKYVIPDSVISIGESAFSGCEELREIVIPKGVKEICKSAFSSCNLRSISIPEGVEIIGDKVFHQCTHLTKISIPASVKTIGEEAFSSMWSLKSITVDPENPIYSSEKTALIENGETIIIYPRCSPKKEYHIPDGVTHITDSAFDSCENLRKIIIPESVKSIGGYAFSGCDSLFEIILPDSIKTIPHRAFFSCDNLHRIIIPAGVTDIDKSAFDWCKMLRKILVSKKNKKYSSINGILCSKDKTELIYCPIAYTKGANSFVIPECIKSIGSESFNECKYIDNITIPKSVISIHPYAFRSVNPRTDNNITIYCYENTTAHIYAMSLLFNYRIIKSDEVDGYLEKKDALKIERKRFIVQYPHHNRQVVPAETLDEFKKGVNNLCEKLDVSLGHDDIGGSFRIFSGYNSEFMQWVMSAVDSNDAFHKWQNDCESRGEELYTFDPRHAWRDRYSCDYNDEEFGEYWFPGNMEVDMSEIDERYEDSENENEKEIKWC